MSQNIVEKGDLEIIVVAHVLSECIGAAGDALIFLQSPMLPPCEKSQHLALTGSSAERILGRQLTSC